MPAQALRTLSISFAPVLRDETAAGPGGDVRRNMRTANVVELRIVASAAVAVGLVMEALTHACAWSEFLDEELGLGWD